MARRKIFPPLPGPAVIALLAVLTLQACGLEPYVGQDGGGNLILNASDSRAVLFGGVNIKAELSALASVRTTMQAEISSLKADVATLKAINNPTLYTIAGDSNGFISSVERFDGTTWSAAPSLPGLPRSNAAAVSFEGRLIVLGGLTSNTEYQASVLAFNKTTWSTDFPQMIVARHELVAVVMGKFIYALGGRSSASTTVSSTERFPSAAGGWELAPFMSSARRNFGGAANGTHIVVSGGLVNDGSFFSTVEILSGSAWQGSPVLPEPRAYHGMVYYAGAFFVVGGYNNGGPMRSVLRLESTLTWSKVTPMGADRYVPAVAVFNGSIYVIGGANAGSPLNTVERFNGSSWAPDSILITARNANAAAVI